ncbi:DUF1963 domain-containing protein [Streptomyces sp. CA-288835]|uniref:DUF1963 domain-containing protein n=1 Tax=Streptomyces sp. CA-288835 TaxID=3240069 RepID=UPI003D914016
MDQRERFRILAAERRFPADEVEHWLAAVRLYANLSPGLLNPPANHPQPSAIPWPGNLAGRIGGLPRLPAEVPWPTVKLEEGFEGWPIPYVGSVDCAGLPPGTDVTFPADGTLLFFAEEDFQDPTGSVIYVPAGVETTEVSPPDTEEVAIQPEQDLYASLMCHWPSWLTWTDTEVPYLRPAVAELRDHVPRPDDLLALAHEIWPDDRTLERGIAMGVRNDPPQEFPEYTIAEEELAAENNCASVQEFFDTVAEAEDLVSKRGWQLVLKQDWVTLATFEIPEHESFFARFVIHRDDLAALNFDRVRYFQEH